MKKQVKDMLIFTNQKDWKKAQVLDFGGWMLMAIGAGLITAKNNLIRNSQVLVTETEKGKGTIEKVFRHNVNNLVNPKD